MSTVPADLLGRYRPSLRYDSNECYFADSAAEWTDHPGNSLRRGDEVIAEAGGTGTVSPLSLDFLRSCEYPDGQAANAGDLIACADQDYRAAANALHEKSGYRNKMYGRALHEPGGGALWLQYWFFYFYNDFNLIGRLIKAGLHEGDWEMIQLRLPDGEVPNKAVYAQHRHAGVRPWGEVEKIGDERPVVYVARGSHASYFHAGPHWTGVWWDHADGDRLAPDLDLELIDAGAESWAWIHWPGRWGGTTGGSLPMDDSSPVGPIMHSQWHDPRALLPRAAERQKIVAAAETPLPVLGPVTVDRSPDGLLVTYEAEPTAGEKLRGLVVTINSAEEPGVPPKAVTVPATQPAGTVEVAAAIDAEKAYDIAVSAVFDPDLATESTRIDLPADPTLPTPPLPEG